MKSKLFFITLISFIFTSQLCFAKIETIKDEFFGTEYYQTEVVTINYSKMGVDWASQIRFRTANGDKTKIILDIAVVFVIYNVFVLKTATLRCLNGKMINLINEEYGIISESGRNFTFAASKAQAIRESYTLNKEEIEWLTSGVDMLRITTKDGFNNIKITQKESKKIVDAMNELLEFVSSK